MRGSAIQPEKRMRSFNCIYVLFKLRSRYMCFMSKSFTIIQRINSWQSENNRPINKQEGREGGREFLKKTNRWDYFDKERSHSRFSPKPNKHRRRLLRRQELSQPPKKKPSNSEKEAELKHKELKVLKERIAHRAAEPLGTVLLPV